MLICLRKNKYLEKVRPVEHFKKLFSSIIEAESYVDARLFFEGIITKCLRLCSGFRWGYFFFWEDKRRKELLLQQFEATLARARGTPSNIKISNNVEVVSVFTA